MLGTDYQLPEGYQLATGVEQVTNVAVPFGATAGHTVVVEPVQEAVRPTVLTVTFETVYGEKVGETVASTTATGTGDWTFMLGTDYQLPAGYQLAVGVDQVTNIQVPFGATAGHTMIVEKTQKLQINQIQRIRKSQIQRIQKSQIRRIQKSQIRRIQKSQIKIMQTKMTGKHRIRIKRQRIKLKHQKQVMIFKPQVHFQS